MLNRSDVHDDDGTLIVGHRHRLGVGEVDQLAEAVLGVLRHDLHPIPRVLLASCDEYATVSGIAR